MDPLSPDTLAVVAGRPPREPDAPLSVPVVAASTYVQGGPVGYGRYGNPTWEAFESALGALEGGEAVCFASGLAAVSAVLDLAPGGSVVVAPDVAYAGTRELVRRQADRGRFTVRWVDATDSTALAEALAGCALLLLESPTNPLLDVVDLPRAIALGHRAGALVAVDSTFATPVLQRPLQEGADLVVHSATKAIAGHSDVLLGAVVGHDPALVAQVRDARSYGGAVPGPFEAWLALRGLRTLPLRVRQAQASAAVLADRLRGHPAVLRVRHPGWGTVVSVDLADAATADRLVAGCRLWVPTTSLGGVESTLERRRRWAHESRRVPEGLVRLSVGVEDVEDLWTDLRRSLDASAG